MYKIKLLVSFHIAQRSDRVRVSIERLFALQIFDTKQTQFALFGPGPDQIFHANERAKA